MGDGAQGWQLAQINIGKLIAPVGDPRVQPFFDALDKVNAIADASPGFVWRLQSESGTATDIEVAPDPLLIVNMSVWEDATSLFDFVYRSAHTPEMARRREYFHRFESTYQALWWVPEGHRPSIDEGLSRLWMLDRYGPTPQAFTFKARFPHSGEGTPPVDMKPDPWCIGNA
ncbi:DUF3291 domain-containing protein [Erythrobacter sp. CCH5-A1]|jgi:hypothetical protein|uniref:DUF3291 domain-containing protein n=1 Tax=Erythrobacter sp. CCH5-A1 TaxID=1768792 RepID=UPI00082D4530|nr:DUF3291 domain-containing protein [Erythrobacter sp. CCH5-A1]